jgi:hypothetical protein
VAGQGAAALHAPVTWTVTESITVRLPASVAETSTVWLPPVRFAGALNTMGPPSIVCVGAPSTRSEPVAKLSCESSSARTAKPGLTH